MGHEIDLNKYNIRTDLILESITDNGNYIDTKTENYGNISVTSVNIDDESSKLINRKKGKYVTILFNDATDKENCERKFLLKFLMILLVIIIIFLLLVLVMIRVLLIVWDLKLLII